MPQEEFNKLVRRNRQRAELDEAEAGIRSAREAGDDRRVRDDGRKALALRESLGQLDPADEADTFRLLGTHAALGTALLHLGEADPAGRQFDRELVLAERLAADFPAVTKYREAVAAAHSNVALGHRAAGRDRDAVAELRKALPIREALAANAPGKAEPAERLALVHSNLGVLLAKTGDDRAAEESYRKASEMLDRLAADMPAVADQRRFRSYLATCRHNLGRLLARTGRPREAEPELRAALDIRQDLVAERPDSADAHNEAALSLVAVGLLLRDRAATTEAVRWLRRGVAEQQDAVRLAPENPGYRRACLDYFANLADTLRLAGQHAASVGAAVELAAFRPDDAGALVLAARLTARCVPAARTDPTLSPLGCDLVAEVCAAQAVRWLERAATNPKGLHALATDNDFAPIRHRPDFRKLVGGPPD
jgi:tetratricopeptide (TPR) repeat protein